MVALLDHTGTPFRREPQRAAMARLRARYDAAQTTRENQNHWSYADSLSAAAANSPDVRRTLRNRARYEFHNNTYCCGMVRTLANDTIGAGPTLQVLSGDRDADSAIEMAFWRWAQVVRLAEKLRTMRIARCVDGETFGLLTTNYALPSAVKLDLRVYEADQVACPWGALTDPSMSDGILFDDFGNPLSYTLLKRHPGDTTHASVPLESEQIPARNMLHLFRPDRPGQIRGIPEIMAALPLYAQLRRYTLAVIAAAETAADLAAVLQTQQSPDDPDDLEPLDLFDLERRSIMTLPRGWVAQQMRAEQPTTTYGDFKRQIVNEIARCLGMPYNIAAGDSAGYNYASGRLDHQTYFKLVDVDRRYIASAALEPLFERWWEEASLVPGVLPEGFDGPPLHEWHWEGHEHVDPLKEANSALALIDGCVLSEAEYHAKRGRDWEEVEAQVAKELGIDVPELRELKRGKRFTVAQQPTAPEREGRDGDE